MGKPTLKLADFIVIAIIIAVIFIVINILFNKNTTINFDLSKDTNFLKLDSGIKNIHDSIIIIRQDNEKIKEKYYYESKIFNNYIPDSMRMGYIYDKSKELLSDSL